MIDKLINMAKNGMFDTAFLLASKYNLERELFNSLKGKYDITFNELKELVELKEKKDIEYLDICYNLKQLYCNSNLINELNTSNNVNLKVLKCMNNNITQLDLSNNVNLTELYCSHNTITTLDINNCVKLTHLYFYGNNITTLDINNCVKLTDLYFYGNNITTLDVSKCINLIHLYCWDNPNLKIVKLNKKVDGKIYINKDIHTKIEYVN